MKLINQGKVKDVYELNDKELLFKFSDRISVFDQIIPSMIPRKVAVSVFTTQVAVPTLPAEELHLPSAAEMVKSPVPALAGVPSNRLAKTPR